MKKTDKLILMGFILLAAEWVALSKHNSVLMTVFMVAALLTFAAALISDKRNKQ